MSTREPEKVDPWERQPGESQRAFSAFNVWLRLPTRSVLSAYRVYSGQETARNRPGYFGAWATQHRWLERGRAWDDEIARQARQREVEAVLAERQKWAERRSQVAELEWGYADQLIGKASEMLAFPVQEQRITETQALPDGRTIIQHITIKPGPWRSRDAGYMVSLGTKMRRLAADMATERIETIDPVSQAENRLAEAARTLADVRTMQTDVDDAIIIEKVAAAFGLSVEELTKADAGQPVTTGLLVN